MDFMGRGGARIQAELSVRKAEQCTRRSDDGASRALAVRLPQKPGRNPEPLRGAKSTVFRTKVNDLVPANEVQE